LLNMTKALSSRNIQMMILELSVQARK
jgi:hypothetical protein